MMVITLNRTSVMFTIRRVFISFDSIAVANIIKRLGFNLSNFSEKIGLRSPIHAAVSPIIIDRFDFLNLYTFSTGRDSDNNCPMSNRRLVSTGRQQNVADLRSVYVGFTRMNGEERHCFYWFDCGKVSFVTSNTLPHVFKKTRFIFKNYLKKYPLVREPSTR